MSAAALVLHRDIYWLGRQWCVTGYGIQATNPKLRMGFDVPADRIWADDPSGSVAAEPWFDRADFSNAVEVARRRAKEQPNSFRANETTEK